MIIYTETFQRGKRGEDSTASSFFSFVRGQILRTKSRRGKMQRMLHKVKEEDVRTRRESGVGDPEKENLLFE